MLNFKTLTTGLALAATLGVAAEARDLRTAAVHRRAPCGCKHTLSS